MNVIEYGTSWLIEDQLDSNLVDEIKNFFDNNLDGLYQQTDGYSTKGNSKQYWLYGDGVSQYDKKQFNILEKKFTKNIFQRLNKISILKKDIILEHNSSWTAIGREGAYDAIHNHGHGDIEGLSCVLYLNVPESCDGENNIFLVLHTDPTNKYISNSCPSIYQIKPKIGTLLIFPPHIPHGTFPQSKGVRQTFNVNYNLKFNPFSNINISFD